MNIRFDGKNAVVTGGARGIGRAIAMELAAGGANIVIGDVLDEAALKTCEEIKALGVDAKFVHCDVSKVEDCEALIAAAQPRIDIVANAAGIAITKTLLGITQEEIRRQFQINAIGSSNIVRACLPRMIEQNYGRILLVASTAGKIASTILVQYGMSKSSVIALSMSTALTGAKHNVTCNALCPGIIRTQMWEEVLTGISTLNSGEDREAIWERAIKKQIPLGHAQTPEDMGCAAAFLLSDQAYCITGQTLNVDGGQRSTH